MIKLYKQFSTYGKGDNAELYETFTFEDTPENRQAILDDIGCFEAYDSVEKFVKGETNTFSYGKYGGDWDDPTGGYIEILTKEEALKEIDNRYKKEINNLNKIFEEKSMTFDFE